MGVDPTVTLTFIAVGTDDLHVRDDSGLTIVAHGAWTPLHDLDLLVVPGGLGADALVHDERTLAYLRTWGAARPIASVCSGSLLLGAAGYLRDRAATTHHTRLEQLRPYAREVREARVVDEGQVITAGGVAAGLDLGLHLVARFWGEAARARIARQMNVAGAA
jgi:cyclohexyl-isocyanide hydratase